MQYDERSNGHEISAQIGEDFEVALLETRTAGYHWVITENGKPILELLSEENIPKEQAVGGSGHHLWHFRAASQGETTLAFEYTRPWETAKPTRTFTLKVRVSS